MGLRLTRLWYRSSLLVVAISSFAWAADSELPPWIRLDPEGGAINGRTAMAFLPVDIDADAADPYSYFLDPEGCTAHYVLKSDLDTEEVYPCGEWVQPSSGRYFAWIEKGWERTPYVVHGLHSAGPSRGRGMISGMELAPAGRVALPEPISDHSLHVLHLNGHLHGEYPQREIFRRIREESQAEGALFPEGPFVAFLYDRTANEYVWATQQGTVSAGQTTTISPPQPTKNTTLFVSLIRGEGIADYDKLAIDLRAGPPGEERPPDVSVPGVYHYHALWYNLDGTYARVTAETDTSYLEPVEIPLRAGKVETFTGTLKARPNLEAVLDLPPELPAAPRTLEVIRPGDYEVIRTAHVSAESYRHVLQALPAQELRVSLQSPPWTLTETVDLSDGLDQTVTFAPRPIVLEGTVYVGSRPHPATVVFATNRAQDELRVETDDEGFYETVLFRSGVYLIRIELPGQENPGFMLMTDREPITESRVLDFHLPGNRFEVEVTDRNTGEPVEGALISCHNNADEGTTVGLKSQTDEGGIAVLPPLRPGTVRLSVHAEGYLPERIEAGRVEESDRERSFPVRLEPKGESRHLFVRLSTGRPAAFAEVLQQEAAGGGFPWHGTADAEGRLEVPDVVRGSALLVWHPEAAFLVKTWQPGFEEVTTWQLALAQPPLHVRVLHSWGDPAAFARVAVKVDGRWLTASELAWLTRSRTAATHQGNWTVSHLPEAPVEVVAWTRESQTAGLAFLDSAATVVPWPRAGGPVEIQVLP